MAQYLTVKQAVEATGKSDSTIKRLLTSIKNDPDSPDRQHILPSIEQYAQLQKSKAPFQWEISEDLLKRRYSDAFGAAEPKNEADAASQEPSSGHDSRYVQHLEQQVSRLEESNDELRQQNSSLTSSLTSLTDRVTNMLGHYQVKALGPVKDHEGQLNTAPTNRPKTPTVEQEDTAVDVVVEEEGTDSPQSSASSKPKASRKKSSPKKASWFERYTPTFHKAFSDISDRKS